MVTEYGILPMATRALHERVPHAKTMLLFGTPSCGKTLLSYALANAVGANFFNLSPRNTDAKYPGKSVSMLTHMVFKVSRLLPLRLGVSCGSGGAPASLHCSPWDLGELEVARRVS
jgi:hypothetical protein